MIPRHVPDDPGRGVLGSWCQNGCLTTATPPSPAKSGDESAAPSQKTREVIDDKQGDTVDKKNGVRKHEDAPPYDDSPGSEKSSRDLRIRRE